MLTDVYPAFSRGISDNILYEETVQEDFAAPFFHEAQMDGLYEDVVTWEGLGLPVEHFPMQRIDLDSIRPSFQYRIMARSWVTGFAIAEEDQMDDLYNLFRRFLPMAGGEVGRSFYALRQILAAQFFGLYGYQSGTGVPFSPDGLAFGSTVHPMSLSNQAQTWSNTLSVAGDLTPNTAMIMSTAITKQLRPNAQQFIPNKLVRIMIEPSLRYVAEQIFSPRAAQWMPFSSDRTINPIANEGVQITANPYFTYSSTAGAAATPVSYNRVVGQGQTHYCVWKKRSAVDGKSRYDNSIRADIVTFMMRMGYGLIDPRGLFFIQGL